MATNSGYTGRYELQELLGQEGMAEVWKAFDTQARQYVAIKFLHANLRMDPEFATRFQREAQILASLRHPNIVQYHDFFISQPPGTGNTTASVVMDYVDGGTLGDYIQNTSRQGKFLPVADVVRLFAPIGAALDYAHQHGVVHGQLKPATILLDRRNTTRNLMGEPIVSDFGMAKLLATAAGHSSGWWLGTPLYTSPEQIMGTPGDARSDVYSLGIILYEISAGTPPFPGNNPATIMMQHINTIPASPVLINPNIPPALVTIIMRAIAKDPALRFPSISAMMTELAQAVGQVELPVASLSMPLNFEQAEPAMNANLPTIMSSGHPAYLTPPPGITPSASLPTSLPGASNAGFAPLPAYTPIISAGVSGASQPSAVFAQAGPATPMPTVFAPGQVFSTGPSVLPSSALPPLHISPPRGSRRRGLWLALSALLALLVIGSALGSYFVIHRASSTSVATTPIVGHAYFVSSGLLSANPDTATVQGITDQLEIKLEHVPQPVAGKSYYGWLLNAKNLEWLPIPLGPLSVNNGTLAFAYAGDAQHSDLLATNSRFLITEEDTASPPITPDPAALVYYAAFSEIKHPFGTEQYSLYDHIRHLLANDPKVQAAGLTGGLDIWLYRNTEKVLEWAGSARDADLPATRNLALVHRQLTRIIDYLDGATYAQRDLPGQPLLVDPAIAKIGLLTFDPANQDPPGYLYHMEKHLHEIAVLPEVTATQQSLALQIGQGINTIDAWDHTIRTDVLTLLRMSDAQLVGSKALSLFDEVATLANNALVGQVDPLGQVTDGVIQVHYAVQRLATFGVQACTASNPCPALV
ncbi:MAG TPA: protein kinase [Ktedonobacteraceae bacterium]|jgi:serine/threonine protein kinase